MFQVAGKLQKRYGTWAVLAVTQVAYVVRFVYYSRLTEPWAVLPCEVLHGLTFATMWTVSTTYANEIAPPGCHGTMQAILEGLHLGFGSGVGALAGGFGYDLYGAVGLFQLSALLSCGSTLLSVWAWRWSLCPQMQKPISPVSPVHQATHTHSPMDHPPPTAPCSGDRLQTFSRPLSSLPSPQPVGDGPLPHPPRVSSSPFVSPSTSRSASPSGGHVNYNPMVPRTHSNPSPLVRGIALPLLSLSPTPLLSLSPINSPTETIRDDGSSSRDSSGGGGGGGDGGSDKSGRSGVGFIKKEWWDQEGLCTAHPTG